jgi:hypothetical protein
MTTDRLGEALGDAGRSLYSTRDMQLSRGVVAGVEKAVGNLGSTKIDF